MRNFNTTIKLANGHWISGYADISDIADWLERAMSNNAGRFPDSRLVGEAVDFMRAVYLESVGLSADENQLRDSAPVWRSHTPSEVETLREAALFCAEVSLGSEVTWAWHYCNLNEGYVVLLLNSNLRE
jgi:hypothetical protein